MLVGPFFLITNRYGSRRLSKVSIKEGTGQIEVQVTNFTLLNPAHRNMPFTPSDNQTLVCGVTRSSSTINEINNRSMKTLGHVFDILIFAGLPLRTTSEKEAMLLE